MRGKKSKVSMSSKSKTKLCSTMDAELDYNTFSIPKALKPDFGFLNIENDGLMHQIQNSVPKISQRPILQEINNQESIIYARMRGYYLKVVRIPLSLDPYEEIYNEISDQKVGRLLLRTYGRGYSKKFLKRTLTQVVIADDDANTHHLFYLFREIRKLDYYQDQSSFLFSHRLAFLVRHVLHKRLFEFKISGNLEHEIDNYRNFLAMMVALKKFMLKCLVIRSEFDIFNPFDQERTRPFIKNILRVMQRYKWLNSIHIDPLRNFILDTVGLHTVLNKLPNLTDLMLTDLENSVTDERFTDNLVNVTNLKCLFMSFNSTPVRFFQRVIQKSYHLKTLFIYLLPKRIYRTSDHRTHTILVDEEFHDVWPKLCQIQTLEEITLVHSELTEPEKIPAPHLIDIKPISGLTNLRRLNISSNVNVRRRMIDLSDLGKALMITSKITYLELQSYFSNKGFSEFLHASANSMPELKEIVMQFEFYQDIIIGPEFVDWMKTKQQVKYFSIQLGLKARKDTGAVIVPQSLKNLCEGIACLPKLTQLKLCLGLTDSYKWSEKKVKPTFKNFNSSLEKQLISNLIKRLPNLTKLILSIGTGYLVDAELRRIMHVIKENTKIYFLGLGGDFSKITNNAIYDFMEFLVETAYRLKSFYFSALNFKGTNLNKATELIEQLFGPESTDYILSDLEL